MVNNYNCLVHSFDPFVESRRFAEKRKELNQPNASSLIISPKWTFHRIGIVGENNEEIEKNVKIGTMMTLDEILDYTKLKNKVILYLDTFSNHAILNYF
jgi:hypothetical protein